MYNEINILLYKTMYNDNICFYYTIRCIVTINISLYKTMYNDIKYFYYTRRRIMTLNIFIIQDDV